MCDGDLGWKSYMFNLPKGLLSFATRAAINVLPSGDNLKLWGKSDKTNCELCGNKSTLLHILNNCATSLNQGRYTFRHNAIISHVVQFLRVPPGLNSLTPTIYGNPMITMFISDIDNQNHIYI